MTGGWRRIRRFVVVLLLTLLVLEGAGRVFVRQVLGLPRIHRFDAELGWSLRPDVDTEGRDAQGGRYRIRTNARGLRSPPLLPQGSGERLLILGDSNVFGSGVSVDARFDRALREVRIEGEPLEIVNSAVIAWSTDQECLWLEREGATIAPDVVLLVAHDNDLEGNGSDHSSGNWKPRFQLDPRGALVREAPGSNRMFSRARRGSDGLSLLATLASPSDAPPPLDEARAIELMVRLIERAGETAESLGAEFRLALQTGAREGPRSDPRWKARMLELARAHDWPVIDLDPALASGPGRSVHYFEADPLHWSEPGHAVVGRALRGFLESS